MIRRRVLATVLSVPLFGIAASTSFAATATLGQLFTPAIDCVGPFTYLETTSPSRVSYVVPFDGVITNWAWHAGATPVTGLKLKVGHAAGGGQFVIDAEAAAGPQTPNAVTDYPANIPVRTGQIIGIAQNGGSCGSADVGYVTTFFTGDVPPSTTPMTPVGTFNDRSHPVQVTVTGTPAEPSATQPTGQRAAALKRCKKRAQKRNWSKERLKKCKRQARLLPI